MLTFKKGNEIVASQTIQILVSDFLQSACRPIFILLFYFSEAATKDKKMIFFKLCITTPAVSCTFLRMAGKFV